MQQRYLSPCLEGEAVFPYRCNAFGPLAHKSNYKRKKGLKKSKLGSKVAGGTETVESKHELEKTEAGNLYSRIQDTVKVLSWRPASYGS